MKLKKQKERYIQMDAFIKKGKTGNSIEFSVKLDVSRSYFYYLLNVFEDFGACISYSRSQKSYYYEESFDISLIVES